MERLTISKALKIAEEQTAAARFALAAGECDAEERLQRWCETLEALQIMKERGVPDSLKDESETFPKASTHS